MPSPFIDDRGRRRRRRWPFVLAALVVVGVAAFAAYLLFWQDEGDFSNPNAEFSGQEQAPAKKKPRPERFKWPIYGYTPNRTRYLNAPVSPPARRLWVFRRSRGLIEFQPVLANGTLFFVNNSGVAQAVNAKTGKRRWRRKVGALNASSPAWHDGRLFVVRL